MDTATAGWDLAALRVTACPIPCDAVQVRDADSTVTTLSVLPTNTGRVDLIVWADDRPHLHVGRRTPDPGDVVLAELRMPAHCVTVTNAMLLDRRSMPLVQQIAMKAREGERGRCCRRWLVDSTCLGEASEECARRGEHDWLYDGGTCCEVASSWRQRCHCGATRWTGPPAVAA